jgi:hypothetical protein
MYGSIIVLVIFLLGLYYIFNFSVFEDKDPKKNSTEGFRHRRGKDRRKSFCPTVLVQKGNTFYLYNSNVAQVPGVNPIKFNNLDEYTEFTDWQRSQDIRCPVLFLRESYDAQGNRVYNARPSPTNMQGGLQNLLVNPANLMDNKLVDAGRNNSEYNENMYPGFDPQNQYIGKHTPLEDMGVEKDKISPNPMDPNWGGIEYTQKLIDKGYYKGDEVSIAVS